MAQHRLGHKEQAKATLARCQEALNNPELARNDELQALLGEAKRLLGDELSVPRE